jgi:hypothetical protein
VLDQARIPDFHLLACSRCGRVEWFSSNVERMRAYFDAAGAEVVEVPGGTGPYR